MFRKAAILGIGLIGGSFGLALKEKKLAQEVVGVGRRPATLQNAVERGACDYATDDPIEAAQNADLVLLSPPVGQMRALCEAIAPVVASGALVTDAGSTKADIVRECEPIFAGRAHFIGGHPMAGSEKVGVEAARADLFKGAMWLLTPTANTNADAQAQLEALLQSVGSRLLSLSPEQHDALLAVTSHVPHFSASALVHTFLAAKQDFPAAGQLVAGGWRDGTRVAAGSPEMWRDIALANAAAIETELENFIAQLQLLKTLVASRDQEALENWLAVAAQERQETV